MKIFTGPLKIITIVVVICFSLFIFTGVFFISPLEPKGKLSEAELNYEMVTAFGSVTQPFLAGEYSFREVKVEGEYKFEFTIERRFKTATSYFEKIHAPAVAAGWQLIYTSPIKRIYQAPSGEYFNEAQLLYYSDSYRIRCIFLRRLPDDTKNGR